MKTKGCDFEYAEQRDRELMKAYRDQLKSCNKIHLPDVLSKTVNTSSTRFWVSESRAAIIIGKMFRGESINGMKPMKIEMFNEIFHRVKKLQTLNPKRSLNDLVCEVVNTPAPKFYLTPESAKIIICRIKKKWLEERKKKLQHLFC